MSDTTTTAQQEDLRLFVDSSVAFVEGDGGADASRFVNPYRLSDERRAELIAKASNGELVSLPFRAQVYWDVHNANHWRVDPDWLPGLVERANADSAAGRPPQFLYDHGDSGMCAAPTVRKRVGHVTGTSLTTREDGTRGIVEEAVLTEPSAQVAFLRRQLDRFSVGIAGSTSCKCSVCGKAGRGGRRLLCDHNEGDAYDGKVCECLISGGHLAETSFVVHPAVPDTLVLSTVTVKPNNDQVTADAPRALEVEIPAGMIPPPPAPSAQHLEEKKRMDRIQELEAAQAASDAKIKKLTDDAFALTFDQGVREGRLLQAEREDVRALFDAKGADVEWFRGYVSRRPVHPQLTAQPTALASAEPPSKRPVRSNANDLALAAAFAEFGILTAAQVTPEALERTGFNALRIK